MRRVAFLALFSSACVAQDAAWRTDVVAFDWSDHTIAVRADDTSTWLLHGRHVTRLRDDGSLERFPYVLPMKVTPLTHATADGGGGIWFGGGKTPRVVHVTPGTWKVQDAPALDLEVKRGFRMVVHGGELHLTPGGNDLKLLRLAGGKWHERPDLVVVNGPGKFSAGLLSTATGIGVFGDHHIGWLDTSTNRWRPQNDVHVVLRLRPALERGGMSAQDPETGLTFVTLGKGARSLGVADLISRRYFHLTPRLPEGLTDSGETLYVSGRGAARRLNVASIDRKLRWSIPLGGLKRIDHRHRVADAGSPWEVWNSMEWGAHGELIREKDGLANMVVVGRWMYTQRKNLVRRFHLDEKKHSDNMAGHAYGSEWITRGAAMVSDGERRIFMHTGHDRVLWVLDTEARADGRPIDEAGAPALHEMKVTEGAELPEDVGQNTALVWREGRLWAALNQGSRRLWSWEPGESAWKDEGTLPPDVAWDENHDLELLTDGGGLVVVSGKTWARRDAGAWSVGQPLPFAASADGGMAIVDPETRRVLVILGGGTRDAGILDLESGEARMVPGRLPDAVSVHGRRIWILETAGVRYLYLYRGHDSDELWRIAL